MRQGDKHLVHELLDEFRVVSPIEHRNVQELGHIQEPAIVQERCLLLPFRSSWLYCDPATSTAGASAAGNGRWAAQKKWKVAM